MTLLLCDDSAALWEYHKIPVGDMFHASADNNIVRSELFELLKDFKFDVMVYR